MKSPKKLKHEIQIKSDLKIGLSRKQLIKLRMRIDEILDPPETPKQAVQGIPAAKPSFGSKSNDCYGYWKGCQCSICTPTYHG